MENRIRRHSSDDEGEPPRNRLRRDEPIEREHPGAITKSPRQVELQRTLSKTNSVDKSMLQLASSFKQCVASMELQLKSFTGELNNFRNKLASVELQLLANNNDSNPAGSSAPIPSTSKANMKTVKVPPTPDARKTMQQNENIVIDPRIDARTKLLKSKRNPNDFRLVVIRHVCLNGNSYNLDMIIDYIQKDFQKFAPRLKFAPSDITLDHKKYNDTVWVLKCPTEVKEALLNLEYIFLNRNRIIVEDYLLVRHCTKCQLFGHTEMKCYHKLMVCRTCGETGHRYTDCTSTEPICATCKVMENLDDMKTHRTFASNCPIRIYEEKRSKHLFNNQQY